MPNKLILGPHIMSEAEGDHYTADLLKFGTSVVLFYLDKGYLSTPERRNLLTLAKKPGTLVLGRRYADPMPDLSRDVHQEVKHYYEAGWGIDSFTELALSIPQIDAWLCPNEVVIKTPEQMKWYATFCVEFANRLLAETGKLAVLGNWATGTPEIVGVNMWEYWRPVLDLARQGKCILSRHSYGSISGDVGSYNGLRHRRDMAIWESMGYGRGSLSLVLTEAGMDTDYNSDKSIACKGPFQKVYGTSQDAIYPYHNDYLKPLAEELDKDREYLAGACLFTFGNGMGPWNDFDMAHMPWLDAIARNPIVQSNPVIPTVPPVVVTPDPVVVAPSGDWPAWATHKVKAAVNVRQYPWLSDLVPMEVGSFQGGKYVHSYGKVTRADGGEWHCVGPDGNMWVSGYYLEAKP